jgi:perosamine synthetase
MSIPVFNTYIHPEANTLVQKVLSSGFISEGEVVKEFEKKLQDHFGLLNPIALNSGTTALHLAVVLAGIGAGDEVIIPAQTFVATGLVVLQQNAKPVFADVEYETGNISCKSIVEKITERTKAIMPVHWGGYPCDMDAINAIAKEHNLFVIEDAAHAIGASYKGKPIGSISDFTCFSFQAIKHLTTGDGGAIACKKEAFFHEGMTKRWFGIDRKNSVPTLLGERKYDINQLGYKYHLNDYAAALGLTNTCGFFERLTQRRKVAALYTEQLANVPGIKLFSYDTDRESSFWLYGFHVESRDEFITKMKERGITTSVVHQRIDRNSIFGGLKNDLVNQARFDATQIHIPIHDDIDEKKAWHIINAIKEGW